ncbi:MAG TPA: hypothetical protein PLY96_14350 [Chromatiaceae bacterium]|jgi:hypothetical protein|nr:hypothetical protein [Chromatiaceae bacterium]
MTAQPLPELYTLDDYRQVGDFHYERHTLTLSRCTIDFDFGRLWRGRR